jgi:hypothetical protein
MFALDLKASVAFDAIQRVTGSTGHKLQPFRTDFMAPGIALAVQSRQKTAQRYLLAPAIGLGDNWRGRRTTLLEESMKSIILLATALAAPVAFGGPSLPEGKFSGQGLWQDQAGGSGSYTAETSIDAGGACTHYQWQDGATEFCVAANLSSEGFFALENGWGYCLGQQCHYELSLGDVQIEETLTFAGDILGKVGSKKMGNGLRLGWREELLQSR